MSNSKAFDAALEQGQLIVRKMWYNPNAKQNKITIQFAGRTNRKDIPKEFFTSDRAKTGNALVRIASGIPDGAFNFTVLASWNLDTLCDRYSFSDKFLTSLMDSSRDNAMDFTGTDEIISATDLYGVDVAACIERCTVANERTLSPQEPVQAPDGTNVVEFDGKPVYQHTWLEEGTSVKFLFSGHKTVNPSLQQPAAKATAEAPAVQEVASLEKLGF